MSKVRVEMSVVRYFDVRDGEELADAELIMDSAYDNPEWFLSGVCRGDIYWSLEEV